MRHLPRVFFFFFFLIPFHRVMQRSTNSLQHVYSVQLFAKPQILEWYMSATVNLLNEMSAWRTTHTMGDDTGHDGHDMTWHASDYIWSISLYNGSLHFTSQWGWLCINRHFIIQLFVLRLTVWLLCLFNTKHMSISLWVWAPLLPMLRRWSLTSSCTRQNTLVN